MPLSKGLKIENAWDFSPREFKFLLLYNNIIQIFQHHSMGIGDEWKTSGYGKSLILYFTPLIIILTQFISFFVVAPCTASR